MRISWKDYKGSCADYKKNYELLNQILYDLCKKHPNHRDMAAINAKLWIIGRSTASGIERMIKSKGVQGSSLGQLGDHIYKNQRTVESIFRQLAAITEPLTPEKLKIIITEHGRFVDLLAQKLRKNQSPRSFASKYMHFHCPAVPIYDSYASRELFSYRWNDRYEIFERPAGADETYYYFIIYFWQLYQNFKKSVKTVNVRLLDCYLLWRAE